jgi:MscS family membrane protein
LVLLLSAGLAFGLTALIMRVLRRMLGGAQHPAERDFRAPLWMALTFSFYKLIIPVIGLPELLKRISVGTTGVLLALALMWGGWRLIDVVADSFFRRAEASVATMDNIVVSLIFGALKLILLAAGFVFIAMELSLPYESLLAGLSIGGLAVAFASKETISNVFGAGILAIDRPFRRGDWIIAGDTQGTVESVGIRSTRIRTGQDSLVIMPNGKLSDATLNNLGTRRYHVITAKIPVSYASSVTQLEAFAAGLRELISALPQALPHRTEVNLTALGQERIEVEYTIGLDGRGGANENALLSGLMLDILRLAERLRVKVGEQVDPPSALPDARSCPTS